MLEVRRILLFHSDVDAPIPLAGNVPLLPQIQKLILLLVGFSHEILHDIHIESVLFKRSCLLILNSEVFHHIIFESLSLEDFSLQIRGLDVRLISHGNISVPFLNVFKLDVTEVQLYRVVLAVNFHL